MNKLSDRPQPSKHCSQNTMPYCHARPINPSVPTYNASPITVTPLLTDAMHDILSHDRLQPSSTLIGDLLLDVLDIGEVVPRAVLSELDVPIRKQESALCTAGTLAVVRAKVGCVRYNFHAVNE